ncbi:MAG: pantoate--beta-alanine ligase [Prevotellaceae bacterium]|jgi:pantoate--beta-alanine ligase|nr:pantoate--beta-alanine ligase [Prevotellaceae bacterium]
MDIYRKVSDIRLRLDKAEGVVGFVPTMGALHCGHLSLVKLCKSATDITVASIFVNPTQFNDSEDYRRYPRNVESDCEMLKNAGCDIVFVPSEEEIYPEPDNRIFDFGNLDKIMEGYFRPGHFNGVAQVVSRLFDIVKPDKAFFGQKDFQQVAIIKAMARQLNLSTKIEVVPTVRENSGLAMSSRNALLTETQQKNAAGISQSLFRAKEAVKQNVSPAHLKNEIAEMINSVPELKTEYAEIVDGKTLEPVSDWNRHSEIFACVAVNIGKIRLIDNIQLK